VAVRLQVTQLVLVPVVAAALLVGLPIRVVLAVIPQPSLAALAALDQRRAHQQPMPHWARAVPVVAAGAVEQTVTLVMVASMAAAVGPVVVSPVELVELLAAALRVTH
jgi:hypothetical protein